MKTLKFEHNLAQLILKGKKVSTWRLYDDKDLTVNDDIRIIDKVDSNDPNTWEIIGTAKITEIIEKRLQDVTEENMTGHELFATKKEMVKTYQKYYGSQVSGATPVKIIYFDFEPGKFDIPPGGVTLEEARMYTDGGSRGNPGDSACAYVICNIDDNVVEKSGVYMGLSTNNKAEYQGLRLGLERAREIGIQQLQVFMDSQLVINQVNGLYKVKNRDLAPMHQEILALAKLFKKITFVYIPRELNKIADREVNTILDQKAAK